MSPPAYGDYISVAEAAKLYGTTRTYFYEQVNAGGITGYTLPGRRGTWLKKVELEKFMQPKPKKPGDE